MPLVSVIVPVYNVEKYLKQCVDSILNQTFKDFELVLVDDGSPDKCSQICDEYAKKDKRVVVMHKENGGLSSARNAGLDYVFKHSNSEYICFVDSDDYVSNEYLEKLYDAIDGCDISVCYYYRLFNGELIDDYNLKNNNVTVDNYNYWNLRDIYPCNVVAWNKLYKKHIFKTIRYPTGKLYEDELIIHHVIGEAASIKICPDLLYVYRVRENSIMMNKNKDYLYYLSELDIFIDRAFYYLFRNEKLFVINYNDAMRLAINLYRATNKYYGIRFNNLKMIYHKKKKLFKRRSLGEAVFFACPKFYCFVKKPCH